MPQTHISESSQDHTELRQTNKQTNKKQKKSVKLFLLPCIFNQSFVYLDNMSREIYHLRFV
jgi:hypothetical protein